MTQLVFPAYPVLLRDGLVEQPQPNVRRTEMEGGFPKQAVTYTRQIVQIGVAYRLCGYADNISFRQFVASLRFGAQWFAWTDPRLANAGPALASVATRRVRMVGGKVEYTPLTRDLSTYKVAFTLEYLDVLND